MNRVKESLCIAALCIAMMIGCSGMSFAADTNIIGSDGLLPDYTGKTVVLQSNDVHGAIDGYQYMAGLRDELEKRGADVLLVDSGDFMQGSEYVSYCKGRSTITMMNAAGYDVITIGNHDFDYTYPWMQSCLQDIKCQVICDNVLDEDGKPAFARNTILGSDGVKIGFFGTLTPDTKTSTNPKNITGLTILDDKSEPTIAAQAAEDVRSLKQQGADVVIGLAHLGVDASSAPFRSTELWAQLQSADAQPDLLLDGHSHTVMTEGAGGEPILSTGTKFEYIGVVVIDEKKKQIEDRMLYTVKGSPYSNDEVKAAADQIDAEVNELFSKMIGTSKVELNGFRDTEEVKRAGAAFRNGNRDGETNMGDFVADAFRWYALNSNQKYKVPEDHVVSIINGGALRDRAEKGKVTRKDLLEVLPFSNTIVGVYVTGEQLLTVLEACTQSMPEPSGSFPQVSGIKYSIDTTKAYDPQDEPYPVTEIHGPKEIRRVTIQSVNGKKFSRSGKYMVVVNNFCADGGDAYAVLEGKAQTLVGPSEISALEAYITKKLKGVIGTSYAEPSGRIVVLPREANTMTVTAAVKTASAKKVKKRAVTVRPLQVKRAVGTVTYKKLSGSKKLTISKKSGKVTVKKGTKKGTYKIRVRVRASGNQYYNAKTQNVKVTVRVK